MRLVVDANIIFSAAIKDGLTRKLLLTGGLRLHAPEFLSEELAKYAGYIAKKSHNSPDEVGMVIKELFEIGGIEVFATPELNRFMPKAESISPDPDDKDYFALALKLECAIWSNDKELKRQKSVKVYSTEELVEMLG